MRGCFTIHYNGETFPGSTPRSERLKPFLSGLRKVCDISIRLRHRIRLSRRTGRVTTPARLLEVNACNRGLGLGLGGKARDG